VSCDTEILTRQEAAPLPNALILSIREIIRNVVQYSGSETVYVCAQYWPQKEQVEVGIVDERKRALVGTVIDHSNTFKL
jgi:anti-sigma regulatory factor (Ser/Thr protein kinase)